MCPEFGEVGRRHSTLLVGSGQLISPTQSGPTRPQKDSPRAVGLGEVWRDREAMRKKRIKFYFAY